MLNTVYNCQQVSKNKTKLLVSWDFPIFSPSHPLKLTAHIPCKIEIELHSLETRGRDQRPMCRLDPWRNCVRDITFVGQMVISGNSTAVLCYQELLAVTFFTMHYCKISLMVNISIELQGNIIKIQIIWISFAIERERLCQDYAPNSKSSGNWIHNVTECLWDQM